MSIKENVAIVRENIEKAAKKANRDPAEIKIIGVTKTVEVPQIRELLAAGITAVGENRVQDFLPKYEAFMKLPPEERPKEWHFIGHLQRNKVKFIIDKVDLIHSVDSLQLAEEINKRALAANLTVNILIEINISAEKNKHGVNPHETRVLAEKLVNMRGLRVCGLMTVAPFVENGEENGKYFSKMRKILIDNIELLPYYTKKGEQAPILGNQLSFGMSGDYEEAVIQGSTMVRIGTALFGERSYK